ncbi:hypothetical protein ABW19_dt0208806 [Dactylella cylindrospora]|nr:hypothetical protein ABW19_dt0208806 [Dactylella cylindrospora]
MAPKKVLIVGAGAAGMSCAHHLSNHPTLFHTTLVESTSRCGGQAFSIPLDKSIHGASWLNQGVQGGSHIFRHTFAMFKRLGYDVTPVNLQVSFGKGDKFWTNVFSTKFHEKHGKEVKRFWWVMKVVGWLELLFVVVPIWLLLRIFWFSREFRDYMIMPTLALFLGTGNATPEVNSMILEKLFNSPTVGMWYDEEAKKGINGKEGVLSGNNPAMVVFPNLSEFYEKWRQLLLERGVDVRLNTEVVKVVERSKRGVKVAIRRRTGYDTEENSEEAIEEFDEIVFACLADTAKRILGKQASWRERFVLGRTKWSDDVTVTHWDSDFMDKYYTNRFVEDQAVEAKSGYNISRNAQGKEFSPMYYIRAYDEEPDKLEMISLLSTIKHYFKTNSISLYAFNCSAYQSQFPKRPNSANSELQVPIVPFEYQVFQTIFLNKSRDSHLWPKSEINPSKIIREDWWHQLCHSWTHYIFVVPLLWLLNNKRNTRFCGSWTLVNAHETAVISGIAAAWSLGAEYPEDIERDGEGGRWEGFAVLCFRLYVLLAYGRWYRVRKGVKVFPVF